jgi:serine/threonine protein kinase
MEKFTEIKARGIYEVVDDLRPGNQAMEVQIVKKKAFFLEGILYNRSINTKTLYLKKVYYAGKLRDGEELSHDQERLLQEAQTLRNMEHPYIIRYEDFDWQPQKQSKAFLYMEYCSTGDLESYLSIGREGSSTRVPLSERHFWQIFHQLSSALLYCHTGLKVYGVKEIQKDPVRKRATIHRDVKPANGTYLASGEFTF